MFGSSDDNRSEGQGGCREALSTKEVCSAGTTAGTRTGSEAGVRAMSVLENAKSNRHRKTHQVEPGGTGRKFMDLTRGDLRRESAGEVSSGRSSEEGDGNTAGAKGQRSRKARSTGPLRANWRGVIRNRRGAAIAATSPRGERRAAGWSPGGPTGAEASQGLGESRQ